ncbi:MAG: helix-turn-helix transcriptional regulator [Acidobacteria bacterium]|nr:helix-turn-helix transcriptional regulator [Acidobacteriota bacterium]
MPRPVPHPLSVTLTTLRRARGLTGEDLAASSGMSKGLISRYELGRDLPSREKVVELGAVMGYEPEDVDAVLFGIIRATVRPEPRPLSPVDPRPAERRLLREVASRLAQAELAVIDEHLVKLVCASRTRRDRSSAEDLVRWLLEEPDPRARRELVELSASLSPVGGRGAPLPRERTGRGG